MSTLREQYDAALAVINEHNEVILEGKPLSTAGNDWPCGYIDPVYFLKHLRAIGGTTQDRLRKMAVEDVLKCFNGVDPPVPLAKDIVRALRSDDSSMECGLASDLSPAYVSAKKAEKMSLVELVHSYDPEDADNAVGHRLKSMSKGEKFVVFESGRIVHKAATIQLLQEIRQGYPGREQMEVNGEDKPTYRVGELPDNFAEENPIFIGRPLRPDGTCDQTNRSWEGVPLEVRLLIRLAVQLENGIGANMEAAHNLIDLALDPEAAKKIRQRYKKASLEYRKLADMDALPKLKIPLSTKKELAAAGRPFEQGKKVKVVQQPGNWTGPVTWTSGYPHNTYKAWVWNEGRRIE